jgi:hypothetical protein
MDLEVGLVEFGRVDRKSRPRVAVVRAGGSFGCSLEGHGRFIEARLPRGDQQKRAYRPVSFASHTITDTAHRLTRRDWSTACSRIGMSRRREYTSWQFRALSICINAQVIGSRAGPPASAPIHSGWAGREGGRSPFENPTPASAGRMLSGRRFMCGCMLDTEHRNCACLTGLPMTSHAMTPGMAGVRITNGGWSALP